MATKYQDEVVVIVPVAARTAAETEASRRAYAGALQLTVPLSPDGREPATHYACRLVARKAFYGLIKSAGPAFGAQVYDVADPRASFDFAVAGLQRVSKP